MDRPPAVRLPGHFAGAGNLLEWRKNPHGEWWALVEYTAIVPGYRGGIKPEQSWFPAHEVQPVEGEDYSRVPRIRSGS
ncbi:hypothetical protein [Nonomuraea bangladeshensis]|uniref:hypothetical protein n=1 Tax=Nonomuraea bangladeshensis TaxID=404385 RepID=UPI003C2DDA47